ILPSPDLLGYRNRVLVRVHVDGAGNARVGYFARASRDLVAIDRCAIAAGPLDDVIAALPQLPWPQGLPLKIRCELQEIPPVDGKNVVLAAHPAEGTHEAMAQAMKLLRTLPQVHWAGWFGDVAKASPVLLERDLDLSFLTLPGQFQQVNV